MDYFSDIEYTHSTGQDVLAFMAEHKIPANPQNYQIWFAYKTGRFPELTQALKIVLDNGRTFDQTLSDEIHDRFFNEAKHMNDSYREVGDRMQTELDELVETLQTSLAETAAYGDALEKTSSHLSSESNATGSHIKAMVDHLVNATRKMEERSRTLESRLEESSSEVKKLQLNIEDIRKEAFTDQLTGLANRKSFDENLRETAAAVMESGEDMSLLFMDIDHFKKFNDTWGHQTGDTVLRLVAACLRANVKGKDLPARYGGEEFAVVLPNASLDSAEKLAEQIRETVATKKLQRKSTGEELGHITISIGVAKFQPGEKLADFVHRADTCLYAAKRAGRNRVIREDAEEVTLVEDLQEGAA